MDYFWEWVQKNLKTFDDYTPFDYDEFEWFLFGECSYSYEIGDGVGLCTIVLDGINGFIQMVMLDWKFRDDVCRWVIWEAFSLGAMRVTATVSDDRLSAKELVAGLGFKKEGVMRQAFERQGISLNTRDIDLYHDVEIWGMRKDDVWPS